MTNKDKFSRIVLSDPEITKNMTYVSLYVTNLCNMACTYCCNMDYRKGEIRKGSVELSMSTWDNVKKFIQVQGKDQTRLELFGGEPSIYKHTISIINDAIETFDDLRISIAVNTSSTYEFWKQVSDPSKVHLTFSFHPEYVRSYPDEVKKCEALAELGFEVNLWFLATKENCHEIYTRVQDSKVLPTELVPIFGDRNDNGFRALLETSGLDLNPDHRTTVSGEYRDVRYTDGTPVDDINEVGYNYRGMICHTGFYITANGDIHKCAQGTTSFQKPVGNVNKSIESMNRTMVCQIDCCQCNDWTEIYSIDEYIKLTGDNK